ncbi:hypothetical protein SFOMI_2245 [Sphingobium fuliginis]|uniref:Uncharacterized protein n=1 Tax=Sphingobium fuliginis (strain ATCC 27551) TaxID=336203 RepID=A0A292ZFU8_SPHSA|nr:hypothetical protein SFOMI_2245 [Sphingobium fuliginis]
MVSGVFAIPIALEIHCPSHLSPWGHGRSAQEVWPRMHSAYGADIFSRHCGNQRISYCP